MDADVVQDGGELERLLDLCAQSFLAAEQGGIGVDFEEVLDALGITGVKGDHRLQDFIALLGKSFFCHGCSSLRLYSRLDFMVYPLHQ